MNMKLARAALVLALLPPALSHAAGDAGGCRYVPIAKMSVDYSDRTRRVAITGAINGKPARMLVDTGMYETKVLSSAAERLGLVLTANGRYTFGVAGAASNYRAQVSDIAVGDSHTGKMVVPVLDVPHLEKEYDAIVGADYLLQTDMELSLADKTLQFFRASGCADTYLAYWDSDAMEIPFVGMEEGSHKPLVEIALNGVKLRAILDTGAPRTSVTRHGAELAGVRVDAPDVRAIGKSGGIGDAALNDWSADFKTFAIGPETVNNARLTIRDNPPQGDSDHDVLLGIDFLRAHHVLFAMSQRRLYLSYLGGDLFGAKPPPAPKPASASAPGSAH